MNGGNLRIRLGGGIHCLIAKNALALQADGQEAEP